MLASWGLVLGVVGTASAFGPAGFVYALRDVGAGANQIHGFRVNPDTGALTPLPGFPMASGGTGAGFFPSGHLYYNQATARLYALNDGNNTLSAFSVNRTTGALTALPYSPLALTGHGSLGCVTVHPSGSPVMVGDGSLGVLSSINVTATTATPASGSPYSTGAARSFSCATSRDGNYVYAGGNIGSTFAGFSVDAATGVLTPLAGSPFASGADFPLAYATDASGRLFMINGTFATGTTLRVFTTTAGVPTAVSGSPFSPAGLSPAAHGLIHPSGYYVVVDRVNNNVGIYRISGSGSATTLAAVSGSPFATGGTLSTTLALAPNGDLLFAANATSRNLTVFRFTAATGVLTTLGTQAVNTLGSSGQISGLSVVPARAVRTDFERDGGTDITVFRPSTGSWFILYSLLGWTSPPHGEGRWGLNGDIPLSGDFDGDGTTELTVYRPSNGTWYILYSSLDFDVATYREFQWGLPGDTPLSADFDGDGITDLAVYRPSNGVWYIRYSSQSYSVATHQQFQWGLSGDMPISGDFDGDGKADLVVHRPSNGTWYIRYSSHAYNVATAGVFQWGLSGDIPVVADFDHDSRAELTVFRPSNGTWYIRFSTHDNWNIGGAQAIQWGLPGDVPFSGDFDGDGRTELTVFRPSNSYWFVRFSSQEYSVGTHGQFQWGLAGDQLVR